MPALLGRKLGMMSIIDEQGSLVPLTILKIEPNFVTQIKTKDIDGYDALQISAFETRQANKPQKGHFKKAKLKKDLRFSRELRLKEAASDFKLGQEIDLATFQLGDAIEAVGTSKGKGFAGGIKRHNFARQPKSHGGKKGHIRSIGSIGSAFPQKVMKGKKMPGRMGNQRTTVQGLKVGLVDIKKQVIGIKGSLPGPRRSLVMIKRLEK